MLLPPRSSQAAQLLLSDSKSDDYLSVKKLGRGGFGEVHEVTYQGPRRPRLAATTALACKVILADKSKVDYHVEVERSLSEIRVMQAMPRGHPGFVQIFDAFVEETQHHVVTYIVMEKADCGDLKEVLSRVEQLPRHDVTQQRLLLFDAVARQVSSALRDLHAHDLGVVHGDIKFRNVLCFSGGQQLKLSDFGISCKTPCASTGGTKGYMDPLVAWRHSHLTPASDMYSLGVMLYRILTGQHYFGIATARPMDAWLACYITALEELPRLGMGGPRARLVLNLLNPVNAGARLTAAQLASVFAAHGTRDHMLLMLAELARIYVPTPTMCAYDLHVLRLPASSSSRASRTAQLDEHIRSAVSDLEMLYSEPATVSRVMGRLQERPAVGLLYPNLSESRARVEQFLAAR
ncbi:kinase-like domain-containing protein [Scenedesmus sp. NREL 46B-D3]|nr:kinase-like domain-containing protein [Scenedesmus sp. NREL 46B-D3]